MSHSQLFKDLKKTSGDRALSEAREEQKRDKQERDRRNEEALSSGISKMSLSGYGRGR